MSQAKVERYKKEKANRKQILKKEKAKNLIARTVGAVICIGWIGYSGYSRWEASRPAKTTEITMEAISDYLGSLSAEE